MRLCGLQTSTVHNIPFDVWRHEHTVWRIRWMDEGGTGGTCNVGMCIKVLVKRSEANISLEKPRRGWQYNIEMDIYQTGYHGME